MSSSERTGCEEFTGVLLDTALTVKSMSFHAYPDQRDKQIELSRQSIVKLIELAYQKGFREGSTF